MPSGARILTVGGIILDSVIAADGRVSIEQMGGNAVYSAVGAALWSSYVAIAGNVPANYPDTLNGALTSAGIGTDGVFHHAEAVREAEWFLHDADGSREDRLYAPERVFRSMGFGEQPLTSEQRAAFAALLRARQPEGMSYGQFRTRYPVTVKQALTAGGNIRIVHLAPERLDALIALAKAFRDRGTLVSLDPGFVALHEPVARLEALLPDVDIFLPSEKELAALRPGMAESDALHDLARLVRRVVGVKLGSRGALLLERQSGRLVEIPVVAVRALDPVGAGDAFCGGFAAGYVAREDMVEAALMGAVSASLAVEGFGALHALGADRGEMARRLAELRGSVAAASG
jgi:ribokinase